MNKRFTFLILAVFIGLLAGISAAYLYRNLFTGYKPTIELPGEQTLPDFTLVDQNGNAFTLSSIRGKAVVIYFGYTNCPDVCPLVLSKFATTISRMGADADRVAFIFITVDPERDTPEVMKRYLSYYSQKIIGLTGSQEQVNKVLKLYNIYASKQTPDEKGNYLVDHFALVLGADRNHILRIAFTPEMPAEEYLEGVKWLLSK